MITMRSVDAKTLETVFMAALRDGKSWEDETELRRRVNVLVYGKNHGECSGGTGHAVVKEFLWLAAEHWREDDLDVTSKGKDGRLFICLRREPSFPLPVVGAMRRMHTSESVSEWKALRQQKADLERGEEGRRRLFHLCPCTRGDACQRRLTSRNSVPLPETDLDAHSWLRVIMQGPESLRYELLKHVRRLKWPMRVDIVHFDPLVVLTAQGGSLSVTGPPSILVGGRDRPSSDPSPASPPYGGKRTTSDEKRAKGHVRRLAPSLSDEQVESLAHSQVLLAALREQHATLRAENDGLLSRAAQQDLGAAGRDEENAMLRVTVAALQKKMHEAEILQQVTLAQVKEAKAAYVSAKLAARPMAEQRWADAMNSVKLCLTWTGLLGPDRLETLANLVEEVTENILLKLPQVCAAIDKLYSQNPATGSHATTGDGTVGEGDDVNLDEVDDDADCQDLADPHRNLAGDGHTADPGGSGGGAGTAATGDNTMDDAADNDDEAEHDQDLECYPMRWAECYARMRHAGDRVLTFRTRVLLTLMFLRLVHNADVIAGFFDVSRSLCVRVYRRTLCELAAVARYYGTWAEWSALVELTSPEEHATYGIGPDAAVLYGDCTGVKCYRPRSLASARSLYSSYYGMCCFKYLVVVAPNGHIVLVTRAANGGITDDELHKEFGIPSLLRSYYPDDRRPLAYVYDKGVSNTDDFAAQNISVVTPQRLRRGVHFAAPEQQRTDQRVAQLRIINERVIGRMKTYAAAVAPRRLGQVVWDEIVMEVVAFMCNLGRPYSDRAGASRAKTTSGPQDGLEPPRGADGRVRNEDVGLAFVPPPRNFRPLPP